MIGKSDHRRHDQINYHTCNENSLLLYRILTRINLADDFFHLEQLLEVYLIRKRGLRVRVRNDAD